MTKKILAMFLAVLMVVSVLPASVLAAENDCPIAKGEHNLDNCADYTVKDVVAATCAKAGYTTYECNACGDVFTGNFTAKLAHEKSSIVEAAKDPTYTEPGHVTKYHCDLCDTDWFEGVYVIAPYDQNTQFDCTSDENPSEYCYMESDGNEPCSTNGMIHTCAYCGFQVVSRDEHEIDYTDVEIVKDPTATENGEAKAPCLNCGEEATLVIYPNHDHTANGNYRDTLKVVPADEDCITGGTIAHLECVICGKLFVEEDDELVEKTLADLKGEPVESGKHTVPEQAGVPVLKSESDDGETEAEEATCTSAGVKIYDCAECGKEVIEVVPAAHTWTTLSEIAMDCGQNGILTRQCTVCNFAETVIEEAPQHTTLEEYKAAFNAIGNAFDAEALEDLQDADNRPYHDNCYVKDGATFTGFLKPVQNTAECGKKGEYVWNCLNCGDELRTASPKLEHTLVTYTAPATCAAVSYSFQYCINANCTEAPSATVLDSNNNVYSAVVKTQIEVIEPIIDEEDETTVIGYQKVMKDVEIAEPVIVGKITAFGTAKDPSAHHFGLETKVEPTCTTDGTYYKMCADCGYEEKSYPAALGHTLITNPNHATKAPVVVEPTCATPGSITYYCKTCGEFLDENVEGGKYIEVLPVVIELQYTDYTEANTAHGGLLVADPSKNQIGTCTKFGYESYECSGCNHTVIVKDGLTGAGHKDSEVITAEEADTYSATFANPNDGFIVIINAKKADGTAAAGNLPVAITINSVAYTVKFGQEIQILDPAALNIVLSELAFTNKDEDDVEEEDIYEYASYEITICYYTKDYPTCDADGEVNAHKCINTWCDTNLDVANAQTYEFAATKLNKLGHDFQTIKPAVSGVCGEIETRELKQCTRCSAYATKKINGQTVTLDGSVVNDVIPGWDIDEAICANQAPLFDLYYCSECETFHIRNYKPVVPHTWGEEPVVDVPASCAQPGEQHYVCTVCGADSDPEIIPAKKHENSDEEFFTDHCNDTETNRHCVVCCTCDPDDEDHDCTELNDDDEYDCDCMIGKYCSVEVEASVDFWKAPTCTTAGQYIAVCEYCKVPQVIIPEFVHGSTTVKNEPVGHIAPAYKTESDFATKAEWLQYQKEYTNVNNREYLNYVAPTVLAEGTEKFECATCGNVIEQAIDALANLQFSLNASNADAPACDKFAELSLVALTVKASGIDATLAGFNMTIEVDGDALFVGYKWAENTPFLGAVTEPNKGQGEINIVGRVIGSNEIAIEDEVLVTLYFRVMEDVEFSFENDAVYAVNAVEEIESSVQGAEVEVIDLGDVNGDGYAFGDAILDDLQAAINIFMGVEGFETYNVAADINRNGVIDLEDLQLMCKMSAGNMDEFDIWFLNAYEGEIDLVVELIGLCLECHLPFNNHETTCSKYRV